MREAKSLSEKFHFIQTFFEEKLSLMFQDLRLEEESKEYCAHQFKINSKNILFRISKVTPTKVGQFVSIWKRNAAGITQSYNISDGIDFYMIACFAEEKIGIFIFPKDILIKEKIMSDLSFEGKRGIRVYPVWDDVSNTQAKKTKAWQEKYFVDLNSTNKNANKQLLEKLSY